MFAYFRNCSNNSHQVFCEDSQTKGLYNLVSVRWPCSSLKVTPVSQTWQMLNLHYDSHTSDMTVYLCMSYLLMLVSINVPLMQGHSGSVKAKLQCWIISTTKQATRSTLATTVGHYLFTWPGLWKQLYGLTISVFLFLRFTVFSCVLITGCDAYSFYDRWLWDL